MAKNRVLILGASGGFGSLLSELLSPEDCDLSGIDMRSPTPAVRGRHGDFFITELSSFLREHPGLVASSDWILSCLPQEATLDALAQISSGMKPGALFMDVLSVKTPIVRKMHADRQDIEFLSIHPMFAPSVGFRGQNVVVIPVRGGMHSATMENLLERWGSHLYHLTAEQHDRSVNAIQVATHAAVISFGACLNRMNYKPADALPISSPPHRLLLSLLARLVNGISSVRLEVE